MNDKEKQIDEILKTMDMIITGKEIINDQYYLYLCRNALEWSGSQYLEARTEFYSLLLKLLYGDYIVKLGILTDDRTYTKFYAKWFRDLAINIPELLNEKLAFYIVNPTLDCIEIVQFDPAHNFNQRANCEDLRKEEVNNYLFSWYKLAALQIDDILNNTSGISDIDFDTPDTITSYQKTQNDLILVLENN